MSSCCTLRLNRRRAFSRDSPSCSRISAKQTHPQTCPVGPISYYKDLTGSQVGEWEKSGNLGQFFASFPVLRVNERMSRFRFSTKQIRDIHVTVIFRKQTLVPAGLG